MCCKESNLCARKCVPSVNDAAKTVDEYMNSFNDVAQSFGVCPPWIVNVDFAYLSTLVLSVSDVSRLLQCLHRRPSAC